MAFAICPGSPLPKAHHCRNETKFFAELHLLIFMARVKSLLSAPRVFPGIRTIIRPYSYSFIYFHTRFF